MRYLGRLLILLVSAPAFGAAIPKITFTPYPIGNPPTYTVTAIAADPSGRLLWFTDQNFSQIGSIELATGKVTTFSVRPSTVEAVLAISTPQALVFGADGNLWFPVLFAATLANSLGRFDPRTGTLTYFALPAEAFFAATTHLAAGPDGNVWFTVPGAAKLGKVTPSGVVSLLDFSSAPGSLSGTMRGLAFTPDGRAWVTSGPRSIFSVPISGAPATRYQLQGGSFRTPSAIVRAPDGNLYFVQSGTSADLGNRIGRITPAGAITEWDIPTRDSSPAGIAAGRDGKIYFTEYGAKQLGQLDPATGVILESPIPNGEAPLGIVSIPPTTASGRIEALGDLEDDDEELGIDSRPPNQRDGSAQKATVGEGGPSTTPNSDPKAAIFLGPSFLVSRAGTLLELLAAAENLGPGRTSGPVEMKITLPASATSVSAELLEGSGTCNGATPVLTCTVTSSIPAGERASFGLKFDVPRPLPAGSTLTFPLRLEVSGGGDRNPDNNTASETVNFVSDRNATITKTPPTQTKPSEGRP